MQYIYMKTTEPMKKSIVLLLSALSLLACKQEIKTYEISAGDISLKVTNFGARVMSLTAPDRDGNSANIVIGHKTAREYINRGGAVRGRRRRLPHPRQ